MNRLCFLKLWSIFDKLYSQNTTISFAYVDFWPNILLFRTHHLWNSTAELILYKISRLVWSDVCVRSLHNLLTLHSYLCRTYVEMQFVIKLCGGTYFNQTKLKTLDWSFGLWLKWSQISFVLLTFFGSREICALRYLVPKTFWSPY